MKKSFNQGILAMRRSSCLLSKRGCSFCFVCRMFCVASACRRYRGLRKVMLVEETGQAKIFLLRRVCGTEANTLSRT